MTETTVEPRGIDSPRKLTRAIALFGPGSEAALATVVGVLVEVTVVLSVCAFCIKTKRWFVEQATVPGP
jgi:ACR3 family arsenite efflux pump ArsB